MRTRFDNTTHWCTRNAITPITEMETDHLINTVRMFIDKPERTMSMLVQDIDEGPDIFDYTRSAQEAKRESLYNATSMTRQNLVEFALGSPLGRAMVAELRARGVNVKNVIALTKEGVELYGAQ